jgi:phosphotriesterase-related protein
MSVIRTVLGDIPPNDLGVTITHEHLLVDFRYLFVEPADPATRALAYAPIALEHHGWIRFNWNVCYENLSILDVDLAAAELGRYARAGGRSVVDATSLGIGRDRPRDRAARHHGRGALSQGDAPGGHERSGRR